MSFLYILVISLLPIYANVCNNLKFIMETNDPDMDGVIESICKIYYDTVTLDTTVLTSPPSLAQLENEFKEAQKIGKNVIVGELPSLNKTEINSLAIRYNITFWDATLKTEDTCLTHVIEGFGGCTAIAFGLSVIHYSYTKSIIVSDSTSPIAACSKLIHNYLIFQAYPGPELKIIENQADINDIVDTYKDEEDTIILNFLNGEIEGGNSESNSQYLFKQRNAVTGKFNIISFHNVNGEQLLGYENPENTFILSEALLKINIDGTEKYLDIDKFIMYYIYKLLIYIFI